MFIGEYHHTIDDKGRLRLEDANLLAYSHGEYVGLGEKMTDLIAFDIENYIYGLFKDLM